MTSISILTATVLAATLAQSDPNDVLGARTGGPAPSTAPASDARIDDLLSSDRALGSDDGFQNAGAREVTDLPTGRQRLSYVLSAVGAPESELDDAGPSYRDRWLMRELPARIDGLGEPEIVDQIKRRMRRDSTVSVRTRRLEVTGQRDAISDAERFLDAVVRANRDMVMAETVIIRRPVDENSARTEGAQVALLDQRAYDRRLKNAKAVSESDMLAAPRVAMIGAQNAMISVINQVAYIKDFQFEMIEDALIADPEIDVVQDGIVIDITPIIGPDATQIDVGMSVVLANLKRPIEELTMSMPKASSGSDVTIQLPEVSMIRWSSEEIGIGEGDHGFQVTGLRVVDWSEDGAAQAFDIEILTHVRILKAEDLGSESPLGEVIGFDAAASRIFVQIGAGTDPATLSGKNVRVRRDDDVVGRGRVRRIDGGIAIIALTEGEARAGDRVVY